MFELGTLFLTRPLQRSVRWQPLLSRWELNVIDVNVFEHTLFVYQDSHFVSPRLGVRPRLLPKPRGTPNRSFCNHGAVCLRRKCHPRDPFSRVSFSKRMLDLLWRHLSPRFFGKVNKTSQLFPRALATTSNWCVAGKRAGKCESCEKASRKEGAERSFSFHLPTNG